MQKGVSWSSKSSVRAYFIGNLVRQGLVFSRLKNHHLWGLTGVLCFINFGGNIFR
jgi:hypothetical protein